MSLNHRVTQRGAEGKYKAYLEYQDSGVEIIKSIPNGWNILRGKLIFSEFSERSENGDETLLSVSEYYGVKPRGEVIDEGDFLSRAESLIGYKKCNKNDLVMNIMLAWKRGLGVSKYDGIVSPAYSVFRFNQRANPDYMHYLLRTDTYTGYFKTRSTGVIDSRLRLYPESFGNVPIIVPSIEEQKQIAAFLDRETAKMDTLIDKQKKLIALLKEKRQATISHAVTKGLNPNALMKDSGIPWLGEVPKHWEVKRLKYLGTARNGLTYSPNDISDSENGTLVLRSSNVQNKRVVFDDNVYVNMSIPKRMVTKVGDILICSRNGSRALIGKNALIDKASAGNAFGAFMMIYRSSLNDYLFHIFNSSLFKYQSGSFLTSTINQLTVGNMDGFEVPIPPKEEQNEIIQYLNHKTNTIDKLISKAKQAIELIQERRTALISAAVTGKIDVRCNTGKDS